MEAILARDGMGSFLRTDVLNTIDWGYVRDTLGAGGDLDFMLRGDAGCSRR